MKKDYPIYHQSHYDNKTSMVSKLLERIASLEKEVNKLKEENRILKQKYVSSLKNSIKEKANPFSISLHMGDTNGFELNKKKRKNLSFVINDNIKLNSKLNQTQENISMYLTTHINDNNTHNSYYNNNYNIPNNKQMINTNTTSKKKNKKVLSLTQNTFRLTPDVIEQKNDSSSSYMNTETIGNNYKNHLIQKEYTRNFRPNSTQKGLIIKDNIMKTNITYNNNLNSNNSNSNTVSMFIKYNNLNQHEYIKTKNNANTNNEKYQSHNSKDSGNDNGNSNNYNHPPSSLANTYNKHITLSAERNEIRRELKEKENQLIQIHRKLFSKSPILGPKNIN